MLVLETFFSLCHRVETSGGQRVDDNCVNSEAGEYENGAMDAKPDEATVHISLTVRPVFAVKRDISGWWTFELVTRNLNAEGCDEIARWPVKVLKFGHKSELSVGLDNTIPAVTFILPMPPIMAHGKDSCHLSISYILVIVAVISIYKALHVVQEDGNTAQDKRSIYYCLEVRSRDWKKTITRLESGPRPQKTRPAVTVFYF
ncbi:uncharacterized protein LACBIDRAFT_327277 [Laccaria bicolor S238N-H82]|uniref:Predicted protein n=1 Tax=Laccaria bicolor (strain S238N-H82 / ATCC MYA-4686) TaxID=486041 RepID=B0DBQ6_LACBS|nr:uncharacterized protein LACBIDRAFT_327277 [Laccaria bicolor S238N-H82]EDR08225.1 predicted protein [Laccaria bicolor S238N-H82]|eukprot:XP_001881295.1 predicted protein [Laccaria bicolor S238N-H82]